METKHVDDCRSKPCHIGWEKCVRVFMGGARGRDQVKVSLHEEVGVAEGV